MIGGAVISRSFADEIHADGYSKDANECVLVDRLMDKVTIDIGMSGRLRFKILANYLL